MLRHSEERPHKRLAPVVVSISTRICPRISPGGFLAERLTRLTPQQMRDLFVGARFPEFEGQSKEARDPKAWVAALQDKIRQIAERPPCPS